MQSNLHASSIDDQQSNKGDDENMTFRISYPIIELLCDKCQMKISASNREIRDHMENEHSFKTFKYVCSCCSRKFDSINSIKSHYTACKKKQVSCIQNIVTDTGNSQVHQQTDNGNGKKEDSEQNRMTQVPNRNDLPPFVCLECEKQNLIFTSNEKIKWVNHMRKNHPAAYEISKTVAKKRITWSKDEDRILASLEIKLKKSNRGQILNRLAIEWQKLVKTTGTAARSKSAILGRRQQPEYKQVFNELMAAEESVEGETTESTDDHDSNDIQLHSDEDVAPNSNEVDLKERCRESILNHLKKYERNLSELMKKVVQDYVRGNSNSDMINRSYQAILYSVDEFRRAGNQKGNQNDDTNRVRKQYQIRNEKRREKMLLYKQYQTMYNKQKNKLASVLLDGIAADVEPPPISEAIKLYRGIWSVNVKDSGCVTRKAEGDFTSLFHPITYDEIEQALKQTKKSTACGPDKINIDEIRRIWKTDLFIAFNLWYSSRTIPTALKTNRTVLIPKGNEGLDNVRNWRPITIASVILRLYNRILCTRMSRVFKTSDKQMGFKPVNGCGFNITWLNLLLQHARRNKRNIYACMLDVSKAFDSVPHESILRALANNNAPTLVRDIIKDQYTDIHTYLAYPNLSSQKIKILRGVKQGDPLSSLLFNLVIDEIFDVIGDKFGYEVSPGNTTNAKCFADDLVLVSGSKIGMGQLLETVTSILGERGLQINPSKCISIGLAKGYKGKKSKIENEPLFHIKNTPIPMLGYIDNLTKYLGIQFSSIGAVDDNFVWKYVKETISKIEKVRIKPHNKIEFLRNNVIPRFIYMLTYTDLYPKMLHKVDRYVRQSIRRILHLSVGLSNEFFYLSIKDGGLQIPNLHDIVSIAKIKLYRNIKLSGDVVLKQLIETQGSYLHERFLNEMQLGGIQPANEIIARRIDIEKNRRIAYSRKIHGVGFEIFSTAPQQNRWLSGTDRFMNARTYIQAIKLRTNSLETRVTCTRGQSGSKICRLCGKGNESLMHVLQVCDKTRGLRYTRHHEICRTVAEKMLAQGYEVFREQSYNDGTKSIVHSRPDIVIVKNRKAIVLDVTTVYERTGASFVSSYDNRVSRYKPLEPLIMQKHDCDAVEFHGLTVGTRGSIFHNHIRIWKSLGLTDKDLNSIAIKCMKNSLRVYAGFRKDLKKR
jgi:Reverse transcriptase (RNA-dependent DNA polymerase)